jgi:hypothetical protein
LVVAETDFTWEFTVLARTGFVSVAFYFMLLLLCANQVKFHALKTLAESMMAISTKLFVHSVPHYT